MNARHLLSPQKRGDCSNGLRPCPWIRCKHHMIWWYHLNKEGCVSPKSPLRQTDDDVVDFILNLPETCTLDIADKGGATLDEIGTATGVTRERIRQMLDPKTYRGGTSIRRLRHKSRRWLLEDFK